MKTYFILRGDNEHLARGELKALLEIYDPNSSIKCYPMICISNTDINTASRVISRAGFIKEAGEILGVYNLREYNEIIEKLRSAFNSEIVHASILKSSTSYHLVEKLLEDAGFKRGYRKRDENRLIFSNGIVVAGLKRHLQDSKSLIARSRTRPFKRSIALKPDITRTLINLSRAREGELLLDPFAGTGSVLIESWFMGIRSIGVDIDWSLVKGMAMNISYFNSNSIVIHGDSLELSYSKVDHIATDLPYGRGASLHGIEIKDLYRKFLGKLNEYLSWKGYAVFMAPLWLEDFLDEILYDHGFKLRERYYDYVHGSLVRVVNVVSWW